MVQVQMWIEVLSRVGGFRALNGPVKMVNGSRLMVTGRSGRASINIGR
jgi:hypothetical protein